MDRHHLLGILLFCIAVFTCVSAQNNGCMDDPNYASTCLSVFFNTTTNVTNTAACGNPVFAGLVPHCPNSCNLCAQLGFGCNNTLNYNTCQALAANCNNTAFKPFMLDYCPQTCALCGGGGGVCTDNIANCSAIAAAGLCNNPATLNITAASCPFTCGKCPVGSSTLPGGSTTPIPGCADTATNCAANVAYCTNPTYLTLMMQQCKRTCNYCNAATASPTCLDQNTLCPTYVKNGFCTNAGYTTAVKQATCQLSCGFCTGR